MCGKGWRGCYRFQEFMEWWSSRLSAVFTFSQFLVFTFHSQLVAKVNSIG